MKFLPFFMRIRAVGLYFSSSSSFDKLQEKEEFFFFSFCCKNRLSKNESYCHHKKNRFCNLTTHMNIYIKKPYVVVDNDNIQGYERFFLLCLLIVRQLVNIFSSIQHVPSINENSRSFFFFFFFSSLRWYICQMKSLIIFVFLLTLLTFRC